MTTEELIVLYQKAINDIDDYFEYIYRSDIDKENVMKIIDKLTKDIYESS